MPEFPIPSARILLVSQLQGGQLPPPCPLSGTPMRKQLRNEWNGHSIRRNRRNGQNARKGTLRLLRVLRSMTTRLNSQRGATHD